MNPALDGQAKLLLFIFTLFSFASMLSGTFVPVYLWKHSESYLIVTYYIGTQYICGGIVFYCAGAIAKRGNKRMLLQLGCFVIILFYIVILTFSDSASRYIFILGCLYGAGLGLYWLAYNIFYFEISDLTNRDLINGWQGLLGAGCGIIAPWLASKFIVWLGDSRGYITIFALSLSLYLLVMLVSLKLHKRAGAGVYSWSFPLQVISKRISGDFRSVGLAVVAQGIKEGMFLTLLPFIVFMYTSSEAEVGLYTLLSSAVAFIANLVIGKKISIQHRIRWLYVGAICAWLAILFIVFIPSLKGLLLYGAVNAVIWPLFVIPFTSLVFDTIGVSKETVKLKEEIIVFRELALTTGRIIGLVPFLVYSVWLQQYNFNVGWLLLLVGFSPIFASYIIQHRKRTKP